MPDSQADTESRTSTATPADGQGLDDGPALQSSSDQVDSGPGNSRRRRRFDVPRVLVGVALILLGGGAVVLVGVDDASPEPSLVGRNAPINAEAGDTADFSAHNSPVVAQDPTDSANVAVANRKDNPDFACALHVSSDGAASFSETSLPVPDPEQSKCFAPDLAYDSDGRLYVLFVTLRGQGNRPHAVWLTTSDDGGQTLSEPDQVLGELSFQVGLTADPKRPGRLYVTWLDAEDTATLAFPETGYPIRFMTTGDGGGTWSKPTTVSGETRERVVAPGFEVGDNGDLHLVYLDLGDDRLDWAGGHEGRGGPPYPGEWELVAARSHDGGATWREASVDTLRPPKRILVFLPEYPSLAVDRDTGRLYTAYHVRVDGDADVWLWHSDDGLTWEGPVQVDDTAGAGTDQYLPQVAVAPTGRVDVVYYDRRADDDNVMNEVSLAMSHDRGETFADHLVVSDRAFDSRIGFGGHRNMADLGSRLGLLSTSDRALAVWADTRAGTEVSEKQDLVRQAVVVADFARIPESMHGALRYGGAGLVLVGGGLVAQAATASRRGRDGKRRSFTATEEETI